MFADAFKIQSELAAGALALSSGFFTKVYDDFNDNKMPTVLMPIIQALIIVSATLFMFQDIRIAIAMGLLTFVSIIQKVIDTDFWRVCAIVPFLVILLLAPTFKQTYLFEATLWFIAIAIGAFAEDGLFPEEKSIPKSIARLVFITSLTIFLSIPKSILGAAYLSTYVRLIMWFCVGYFGTSVLIQNIYRVDAPNEKNAIWEILVANTIRRFKGPVAPVATATTEGFKPALAATAASASARQNEYEGIRAFDFVGRDLSPAPEPTTAAAKAISTATTVALSYTDPKMRIIVGAP
jgi:hypothetical protein